MAATRLSDSQKTELVSGFRAGESTQVLADRFGCSANTVIRVARTLLGDVAYERLKRQRARGGPETAQAELLVLPVVMADPGPAAGDVAADLVAAGPDTVSFDGADHHDDSAPDDHGAALSLVVGQSNLLREESVRLDVDDIVEVADADAVVDEFADGEFVADNLVDDGLADDGLADDEEIVLSTVLADLVEIAVDVSGESGVKAEVEIGDVAEMIDEAAIDDEADLDDDSEYGEDEDDDLIDDEDDDLIDDEDDVVADGELDSSLNDDGDLVSFLPIAVVGLGIEDHGAPAALRPLASAQLPASVYMLVDKTVELQARPLSDITELGQLPPDEHDRQALVVFTNPRQAKRLCGRTQRVIKLPDTRVIERTAPYLLAQGISRVVIEGALYSLPGS